MRFRFRKQKPVKKSLTRKLHRWGGMISALFLTLITVTGILLMNPTWMSSDPTITVALSQPDGMWVGTRSGLFFQKKNTTTLALVPFRYPAAHVVGMIAAPHMMVAFQNGVLLEYINHQWRRIQVPPDISELYSLSLGSGGITVTTNQGVYLYQNETWIQKITSSQQTMAYWVKKLHTGYFLADWMRGVFHFGAWLTLGLIVTGTVLFFRR